MPSQTLAAFSDDLVALVAQAAPSVVAIRTGPNRHITGIHWHTDRILTADQALPAMDAYTVVRPNGSVIPSRGGSRDAMNNLASLVLDTPTPLAGLAMGTEPPVGSLVVMIGADSDARPAPWLAMISRRSRLGGADGPGPILDIPGDLVDHGAPVFDTSARLLGMASVGPNGHAVIVPQAAIARFLDPAAQAGATATPGPPTTTGGRRPWLGVSLQPITIPEPLVPRIGQGSGRMVVNVTQGGPAEAAGLRVGDVLLALDGHSASGGPSLRSFLGKDRIGRQIEVRLLRDGTVLKTFLTVEVQRH